MAHAYERIDTATWKRKEHYQLFMNAVQPKYCVGLELDVTHFKKFVKENDFSFTLAFIFSVTKCSNEIEEFRYRFLDGQVVLYETIDASFAYLESETELFKFVHVAMQDTMEGFMQLATRTAEKQKSYFAGPMANDTYVFSALPWLTFTYISHTDFGNKEAAQPLFDWGKYHEREGKTMIPFTVQVHHAFVDGIHIGKLVDRLQGYLNEL